MSNEEPSAAESQAASPPEQREDLQELLQVESHCPFGPGFFGIQLGGLIRDGCPDPAEVRPVVEVHLFGGEVLDVCHIIGLAPGYVALAVYAAAARSTPRPMRTELVPYAGIARVSIAAADSEGHHVGFDAQHRPFLVAAEAQGDPAEVLMRLAASPTARRQG